MYVEGQPCACVSPSCSGRVRGNSCLTCHLGFPLQTNEKGQVVTKTALLKQMEELIEEPGLTCCICREGYKFQVRSVPSPGGLPRLRPFCS